MARSGAKREREASQQASHTMESYGLQVPVKDGAPKPPLGPPEVEKSYCPIARLWLGAFACSSSLFEVVIPWNYL